MTRPPERVSKPYKLNHFVDPTKMVWHHVMWLGQRVSPPAHGHNPLEIMTEQDYSSKILDAPTGNLLVGNDNAPPPSINFNTRADGEIAKFTEEGFYYKGEFVDDAGEVHRLLKDVLNGICYKQLCIELLAALENEGWTHWETPPDEDSLCLRARAALNA